VARLRLTRGGRCGGPLTHSSYTTSGDTTKRPFILPLQPAISERAVRQLFSDVHRRKLADTCQLMLTAIGWLPHTNNCAAAGRQSFDKRYMRPEYVQGRFAIMCGLRLFLLS
jgi:hypothetical protein